MSLRNRGVVRIGVVASVAMLGSIAPASAEKSGGTLRIYNSTQPPSASIHEESTIATNMPFMAVFNNLVRFDALKPRNGFDTIVPELAESWAWDTSGTKLTLKLRSGVTWHDGQPFTAKDVQCTWHRLNGKEPEYLRRNPRAIWYANLEEVTLNGDHEVTFHLTKPQPSLLPMLASGLSPVYPCHVSGRDMRTKPIGTGPFKFAEFKSHASIKLVRNADYWKKGQPYLDAIEWRIVTSRSTRVLAFVAGEFDMTFVGDITVPLMKDVLAQAPSATCSLVPTNVPINILVNRDRAPFDNAQLRRAMSLSLDRQAYIDIVSGGKARIAGNMMPPPEGLWGMPYDMLVKLPSYNPDVAAQQAEARRIMQGLGYGPSNRLKVKVSTRDFATYRDPAVIFVDQLNKVHFDAELEVIEFVHLAQSPDQEGLHRRAQHVRRRHRRPRRRAQGRLRLQLGGQLHAILHARDGQAARPAVAASRYRQAQGDRLGDRARSRRGGGAPDRLPQPLLDLLARPPQGPRASREQHL